MGDLAVLRGNATVFGIGSLDYTRHVSNDVRSQVAEFFNPDATDAMRQELVARWCVRYVYCPDTDPVDPATVAQLRACDWLKVVAANGDAVLFEVEQTQNSSRAEPSTTYQTSIFHVCHPHTQPVPG